MAPIEDIFPNTEIQKFNKTPQKQRAGEERPKLGKDGLFISAEGKRLQQWQRTIDVAKQEIEQVPVVRKDLVAQIKQKLTDGEYLRLSDEMAGVIAERIVGGLFLG